MTERGTMAGARLSTGLLGATSWALWRTGFRTWVDLTLCMMMGEWVLACRADQAWLDQLDLLEPLRILLTGLGAAGTGLVGHATITVG